MNPNAICAFMKTITLDRVVQLARNACRRTSTVPEEIARNARRAIDRMLELA